MRRSLQAGVWVRGRAWLGRRSRVGRISLWLLAALVVSSIAEGFGIADTLDSFVLVVSSVALFPLLLILLYRWLMQRLLWKVRNRLIVTYLLMGLAPVVLFGTLASVTAYFLAGQYATDIGQEQLNQGLRRVRDQAGAAIVYGWRAGQKGTGRAGTGAKRSTSGPGDAGPGDAGRGDAGRGDAGRGDTAQASDLAVTGDEDAVPLSLMQWKGGAWVPLDPADAKEQTGPLMSGPPPGWLHPGFEGVVANQGLLYLCAEVSAPRNGKTVVALASRPLTRSELNVMAKGLGRIVLSQGFSRLASDKDDDEPNDVDGDIRVGKHAKVKFEGRGALQKSENFKGEDFDAVSSLPLQSSRHPYVDPPVVFTAGLPVTGWQTGEKVSAMIAVFSRPTYLYALLFASSVTIGKTIWGLLIGIAAFFALLELMALLMAAGLSRSITRAVADIYHGTRELDAGHLEHRIPVRRRDQLAALASSFNGMAASVSDLLVQQREKERLLNELAIAQEVQTTLFPKSPASLPGFEIHALCLPARTVGGDYFDFIFNQKGQDGGGAGQSLSFALGDISGKGISAALLMASLHSAVRAFSVGGEEVENSTRSPARMLKLLNHHLYDSTQSARYATLFLATYDVGSRRLTYANGGHLRPAVISRDGSVRRLDGGSGTVVGLLADMEYTEAVERMEPGDLLVAFTDGLTEPENAMGAEYGEERLIERIRMHRGEPLPVLAAQTLKALQEWIGDSEQPDDMTLLLVRQM